MTKSYETIFEGGISLAENLLSNPPTYPMQKCSCYDCIIFGFFAQ